LEPSLRLPLRTGSALATTGEVAFFVGALAAVEDKFGF
jgi:hypothetical protein